MRDAVARRFVIMDVFADRPLAGNPLAVIVDAEGLDAAAMQAIAREFNLSETIFLLPAANPAHSAAVRIFTPVRELPFAGHPTVGAAVHLAAERLAGNSEEVDAVVVLEEAIGIVRCGVDVKGTGGGRAVFDLPRLPEAAGDAADKAMIADAIGLGSQDVGFENHVPTVFSAGLPYTLVPLSGLDAVARIRPNSALWPGAFAASGGAAYLYCRHGVSHEAAFHARMFASDLGSGLKEDPATGSAAAALAGAIAMFDAPTDGAHALPVEQGLEMGRASLITLELEVDAGALRGARIAGEAVTVARGELEV